VVLTVTNSHPHSSHLVVLRPTRCRQPWIGPLAANQDPKACECMLQLPVACDRPHLRPTQTRENPRGATGGSLFALRAKNDRARADQSWLRHSGRPTRALHVLTVSFSSIALASIAFFKSIPVHVTVCIRKSSRNQGDEHSDAVALLITTTSPITANPFMSCLSLHSSLGADLCVILSGPGDFSSG